MLRVLLDLYGERYERGKRARSALDFEDLELLARDLLAEHDGLREQYAERFEHVLVDEFQDTNPLQNELLEQLGRDNLFRVGDENQSIYGFRHADVEVFRGHWDEAAAERARPRASPSTSAAAARCWTRSTWLRARLGGLRAAARGARRAGRARRRWSRAWSCS